MRVVWGFFGAGVGSLLSVVLTFILVYGAQLLPGLRFNHGLVLFFVFAGPIVGGALLGLAFPREAQGLASGAVTRLETWLTANLRQRR